MAKYSKADITTGDVSAPAPTVDDLKVRLDALTAEREALIAERATLQDKLVKVWGSGDVTEAVSTIALNENKITQLGKVIEYAESEYHKALGASYLGEYAALREEIAALHVERQSVTADLAAAQQAYELSRYGLEQAEGNFAGMMSSATSLVEPAIMPTAEITARYGRAVETHETVKQAEEIRQQASEALRVLEAAHLALYHEISLKERRAHELGALTGAPYDPAVAYRAG